MSLPLKFKQQNKKDQPSKQILFNNTNMKKTTLAERIHQRMQELNLKSKDLVQATRASKGSVSQWIHGGNAPSARYVTPLARILKVSEKWLLDGGKIENVIISNTSRIPLISLQQAVKWSDIIMDNDLDNIKLWVETSGQAPRFSFAIHVEGDSMVNTSGSGPSLPAGSILLIDPEYKVASGLIVAAHLPETDSVIVKKLIIDGQNLYLTSLNQNYKPIQIDNLDIIIGVAIRTQMDLI